MRILHVHSVDGLTRGAGAHIAMYRLHLGLKKSGIDSKLLCGKASPGSQDSIEIQRSQYTKLLENLIFHGITGRLGLNNIQCFSTFGIRKNRAYLDADLLHFHGIHGEFFSYFALPTLTASKPAVFTLHDMWPLTGHCSYSYDCDRWKIGCGKCPYPDVHPAIKMDNTRLEWKLKKWVYGRSNISIVSPSNWLTEVASQSMLNRFPIDRIPYGIDTDAYQPLDTSQCRSALGIPIRKKVLMFTAAHVNESRKGYDLLMRAMQHLPKTLKAEMLLLIIGDMAVEKPPDIQSLNLGYISGDRLKAIAYSAADLVVFPSRADNLPLVLQESLACGTPMVSFEVGGIPDLVRPGITGYLAQAENVKDLSNGIIQLLEDESLRQYMSQECRSIALKEYSLELCTQRHVELYHQVLQDSYCVSETKSEAQNCDSIRI